MRLTYPAISLFSALSIALVAPAAQAFNAEQLKDFLKTNQCQNCDLSGANLEQLNLSGANLTGANLSGATLSKSNLSNANLTGANLQGASLSESYLYRSNLTGTNLSNAGLSGANLRETTLIGTNFSRADLRSADFQGNTLGQAMFSGANLSSANLSQTIGFTLVSSLGSTPRTNLSEFSPNLVCLPDATREDKQVMSWEDLSNLSKQFGLQVQTADFTGVTLTGANLQNSMLVKANLSNVDATNTNFQLACLLQVKLTGATLKGSKWRNAYLIETEVPEGAAKEAIGLTPQRPTMIRSRESEAKAYVGSMNRAQQAYYLEQNKFTNRIEDLGLGIPNESKNYLYRAFIAPDRYPATLHVGLSQASDLRTFIGFVRLTDSETTMSTLCVSEKPAAALPLWSAINYKNLKPGAPIACPPGFVPQP